MSDMVKCDAQSMQELTKEGKVCLMQREKPNDRIETRAIDSSQMPGLNNSESAFQVDLSSLPIMSGTSCGTGSGVCPSHGGSAGQRCGGVSCGPQGACASGATCQGGLPKVVECTGSQRPTTGQCCGGGSCAPPGACPGLSEGGCTSSSQEHKP
jgi:hypothetical protein